MGRSNDPETEVSGVTAENIAECSTACSSGRVSARENEITRSSSATSSASSSTPHNVPKCLEKYIEKKQELMQDIVPFCALFSELNSQSLSARHGHSVADDDPALHVFAAWMVDNKKSVEVDRLDVVNSSTDGEKTAEKPADKNQPFDWARALIGGANIKSERKREKTVIKNAEIGDFHKLPPIVHKLQNQYFSPAAAGFSS